MAYKIKNSRFYYCDLWVPDRATPGAIHINKSTRCTDLAQAQEIEEEWRADAEERYFSQSGHVASMSSLCLLEAADTVYRNVWRFNKTGKGSLRKIHIIVELMGNIPITDLSGAVGAATANRIKEALLNNDLGWKIGPDTVDRYMSSLKKVLHYHRDELMMSDLVVPPIKSMGKKRHRERMIYPSEERELFALMRASAPDFCDLFEVLLDTGLRVSEALALSYLDGSIQLTGDAHVVACTLKRINHPHRTVYLTKRAKAILIARKATGPMPFPYKNTRVSQIFKQYAKAMGIEDRDFVPHCLRHTCTTRLLQAGYDLVKVQAMMGHSNAKMTLYYNRTLQQGQTGAAEILDKLAEGDRPVVDPRDAEIARLKEQIATLQRHSARTDSLKNDHDVVQISGTRTKQGNNRATALKLGPVYRHYNS